MNDVIENLTMSTTKWLMKKVYETTKEVSHRMALRSILQQLESIAILRHEAVHTLSSPRSCCTLDCGRSKLPSAAECTG